LEEKNVFWPNGVFALSRVSLNPGEKREINTLWRKIGISLVILLGKKRKVAIAIEKDGNAKGDGHREGGGT